MQIAISQLVFIPDPVPGTSATLPAAARMCTDFNTDQCGTKQVDVAPESLRQAVTTVAPVTVSTIVPNQVSFHAVFTNLIFITNYLMVI